MVVEILYQNIRSLFTREHKYGTLLLLYINTSYIGMVFNTIYNYLIRRTVLFPLSSNCLQNFALLQSYPLPFVFLFSLYSTTVPAPAGCALIKDISCIQAVSWPTYIISNKIWKFLLERENCTCLKQDRQMIAGTSSATYLLTVHFRTCLKNPSKPKVFVMLKSLYLFKLLKNCGKFLLRARWRHRRTV